MPESMKRILMIAYHFPPLVGSSGIQRTLRFVQHLPALGWQPIVLTTHPMAYERTSPALERDIPAGVVVKRSLAFDTARHLAIGGRYFNALARPDRWRTWKYAGIRDGMKLIEKYRPQVIWSTYPIASAHVIAAELHTRSGIPWMADFRDPMAQEGYPADPVTWQQFKAIEQTAIEHTALCYFTTPSAARTYRERYPDAAERIRVLENGYDEDSFTGHTPRQSLNAGAITLLHSGIVYPEERDPRQLFVALGQLKSEDFIQASNFKIRFRAPVHVNLLNNLATQHGISDLIEITPPIDYKEALEEMLNADGLLILQAANCNEQIPAKLYEYLRASRPIIALTDPTGDTASTLRNAGLSWIARLNSSDEIKQLIRITLAAIRNATPEFPRPQSVAEASRLGRTQSLAADLNGLIHPPC